MLVFPRLPSTTSPVPASELFEVLDNGLCLRSRAYVDFSFRVLTASLILSSRDNMAKLGVLHMYFHVFVGCISSSKESDNAPAIFFMQHYIGPSTVLI